MRRTIDTTRKNAKGGSSRISPVRSQKHVKMPVTRSNPRRATRGGAGNAVEFTPLDSTVTMSSVVNQSTTEETDKALVSEILRHAGNVESFLQSVIDDNEDGGSFLFRIEDPYYFTVLAPSTGLLVLLYRAGDAPIFAGHLSNFVIKHESRGRVGYLYDHARPAYIDAVDDRFKMEMNGNVPKFLTTDLVEEIRQNVADVAEIWLQIDDPPFLIVTNLANEYDYIFGDGSSSRDESVVAQSNATNLRFQYASDANDRYEDRLGRRYSTWDAEEGPREYKEILSTLFDTEDKHSYLTTHIYELHASHHYRVQVEAEISRLVFLNDRRTPNWQQYYDVHGQTLRDEYKLIPQMKEKLAQIDARANRCRMQLAGVGGDMEYCAECASYSTVTSVDSKSIGRFYFMQRAPLARAKKWPISTYALRILEMRYSGTFDVNAPIIRDVRVQLRKRRVLNKVLAVQAFRENGYGHPDSHAAALVAGRVFGRDGTRSPFRSHQDCIDSRPPYDTNRKLYHFTRGANEVRGLPPPTFGAEGDDGWRESTCHQLLD